MVIGDKILELRKKSGMSQEQLAAQIGVSRQSISKWESGASMPDNDKLILLSNFFNVSLDYLMEDNVELNNQSDHIENKTPAPTEAKKSLMPGIIISALGVICIVLWVIIQVSSPKASEQIQTSSVVTIDGNGIFLFLSIAAIIVGAVVLLKGIKKK